MYYSIALGFNDIIFDIILHFYSETALQFKTV